jgi:hypothetical protein
MRAGEEHGETSNQVIPRNNFLSWLSDDDETVSSEPLRSEGEVTAHKRTKDTYDNFLV